MESSTRPVTGRATHASPRRFLEFPVDAATVRAVTAGAQTSMLLPHTVPEWPERMQPGFVFTFAARTRPRPGARGSTWRLQATVEVAAACAHERLAHIQTCPAGHRPERVDPQRKGWARVKNRALHPAGGATSPDLARGLAYAAWTVVDFVLIEADQQRIVPVQRPKRYRNATEAELAEDNRYYEWLKRSAAEAGETRVPSLDEIWFRAKSAAYNRKLSAALANGADLSSLTVTDAEVEAELPKFERRAAQ